LGHSSKSGEKEPTLHALRQASLHFLQRALKAGSTLDQGELRLGNQVATASVSDMAGNEIIEASSPRAVWIAGNELPPTGRDGAARPFSLQERLRALAGFGMGLNCTHTRARFADDEVTFRFSVFGGTIFRASFANEINTPVPVTFRIGSGVPWVSKYWPVRMNLLSPPPMPRIARKLPHPEIDALASFLSFVK
jgi:hypothetical protein